MIRKSTPFVRCLCTAMLVGGLTVTPAFAADIHVVLRDGAISPKSFHVQLDERVNIDIVNRGANVHNFVIPDYYIFTSNLKAGESTTASFQAHKDGRFVYYSDKNGVPEQGMEGHMTVTK